MEYVRNENDVFLRLDPGEKLVDCLMKLASEIGFDFALITSGVGMVEGITMGWFCVNTNEYDTYKVAGTYDLSNISGNISLFQNKPRAHVHIVANYSTFETVSGHLIECCCHITMEIGLRILVGTGLSCKATPGRPATMISTN